MHQLLVPNPADQICTSMRNLHSDPVLIQLRGEVFLKMWDARTHKLQEKFHLKNVVTLDASLLIAALCKDPLEPKHGINMLAVGTGALGSVLNPDAPARYQRSLNNEIARKTFAETTFRDQNGAKSAIRTPVVDFTTIFGESEAVGPLNEMGLMSTISDSNLVQHVNPNHPSSEAEYDPTIDTSMYDTLMNYLTFGVITKPSTSILGITWRLSFGG